jgi:hypothetical protein
LSRCARRVRKQPCWALSLPEQRVLGDGRLDFNPLIPAACGLLSAMVSL